MRSMSTCLLEHGKTEGVVLCHVHGLADVRLAGLEDGVNGWVVYREGCRVLRACTASRLR